ncbi:MAG TPA: hypothetical protein VGE74_30160 [Gemmata sp.]
MGRHRKKLLTASPGWGFLCELGLALGKTLAELAALSEAEINLWAEYRDRHGFPADRSALGIAGAGAYVGAVWGGKATVRDLLPKFRREEPGRNLDGVKAWFNARAAKKGG